MSPDSTRQEDNILQNHVGADLNVANEKQITPMLLAAEKGMDEVLAFL